MGGELDSEILKNLAEREEKAEVNPELIQFYRRLLQIQSEVEQRVGITTPNLSGDTIAARLDNGQPLIQFNDLDLDWSLLKNTFVRIASIFAEYPRLFGPLPQSVIETTASPLLKKAVRAVYSGRKLPAAMLVNNVNGALLENIIQATLKPFLASYAKALLSNVNQEQWRRGYCPICGGNPDLAFLDKEKRARWLMCCRCDTEWRFQRLECPFCGNQKQDKLAYFTDDDGLYRLYVCEQCKRYLKTIDLRQTEDDVKLPLERLFTLGMDMQADEYGYTRSNKADTSVKVTKPRKVRRRATTTTDNSC